MLGKEINKINNTKDKEVKALNELKLNYLAIIYLRVSRGENYTDIHRYIFKATINFKKAQGFYSEQLLRNADKLVKKAISERNASGVINPRGVLSPLVGDIVYKALGQDKILDLLSQNVYADLDRRESLRKDKVIKDNLTDNNLEAETLKGDEELNAKIFYLCSTHEDSALDHKPYQGKIYITQKWRTLITNKAIKERINGYIERNDVKTFEWVTGSPVYMITRPNCRHYFNVLSVKEVLNSSSYSELLDKYRMKHKVGTRDIRESLRDTYINDLKSVESIIAKYKERLSAHERLNSILSTSTLREAIAKDKLLIAKWEARRKRLVNTPS